MANPYVNKVAVNGKTVLDLSGDTVYPGMLAKGITAHDKSGAKITGTLEVPATEERTVELSMPSGDQVIQPTSGKVMRKVTVQKPVTLLPENIKKDVVIGGVIGTLEGGGAASFDGFAVDYLTYVPAQNTVATTYISVPLVNVDGLKPYVIYLLSSEPYTSYKGAEIIITMQGWTGTATADPNVALSQKTSYPYYSDNRQISKQLDGYARIVINTNNKCIAGKEYLLIVLQKVTV